MKLTISAVLFGFMVGDDHILGKAIIKDNKGNGVVNTSYTLGIAGGVVVIKGSSRMGWLYERFAELVVEGVVGKYKK